MNPEDGHDVNRLSQDRLADGRWHALDGLRGLIPASLTAARHRLTPSWVARDYPDRGEVIHATYGRLLAREGADWLVRVGECTPRNDGHGDVVRSAQNKAAAGATGKGKRTAAGEGGAKANAPKGEAAKAAQGKREPSVTARGYP